MKQDTIKNIKKHYMIDNDDLKTVFSYLKNEVSDIGYNSFRKGIYMYIDYSDNFKPYLSMPYLFLLTFLTDIEISFRFEFDEETEKYFIVINLVYAMPKLYWIFL